MAGHYGVKRDFGLQTPRVALPTDIAGSPSGTDSQTMPTEEKAKRRGNFAVDTLQGKGVSKGKPSWTHKMRQLFKGNSRRKTGDSSENATLQSASHTSLRAGGSSPALHVRSVKSSTWSNREVQSSKEEELEVQKVIIAQSFEQPKEDGEEEGAVRGELSSEQDSHCI